MARIRVITTDLERITTSFGLAFDAELIGISDLGQRPPGYPDFVKWPPKEWVGAVPELSDLVAQLRSEPGTGYIAFGISDPALLASPVLLDAIEIATTRGVDADIVVDLGD
jgi:hypothetical protein